MKLQSSQNFKATEVSSTHKDFKVLYCSALYHPLRAPFAFSLPLSLSFFFFSFSSHTSTTLFHFLLSVPTVTYCLRSLFCTNVFSSFNDMNVRMFKLGCARRCPMLFFTSWNEFKTRKHLISSN